MVLSSRKRGGTEPPIPPKIVMPPPPEAGDTEDNDPMADATTDERPFTSGPATFGLAGHSRTDHPTHVPPVINASAPRTSTPSAKAEVVPMPDTPVPSEPTPSPTPTPSKRRWLGILLGLGFAAVVTASFSEYKWHRDNEPTTLEYVTAAPETMPKTIIIAEHEPEDPPSQVPVIAASPVPVSVASSNAAAPVSTPAAAVPPPTPAPAVAPPSKPTAQASPTSLRVSSMGPSPSCKADCDWGGLTESGFPKTSPQKTRTVVCGNEHWIASAWVAEGDGPDAYKRCYTVTGLTSADPDGP